MFNQKVKQHNPNFIGLHGHIMMRQAAYAVAVSRVVEAMKLRGWV